MKHLHLFMQWPKSKTGKFVGSFESLTDAEAALSEQSIAPRVRPTGAVLYEAQSDGALAVRAYYMHWLSYAPDFWRVKHVEEDQGVRRAVEPYKLPVKEPA